MDCLALFLLLITYLTNSHGARILGIFPSPFYSHQQPYQVLMKALVARGHHVTVVSPNPLETHIENYTDIDLSFSYKYWKGSIDFTTLDDIMPIDTATTILPTFTNLVELQLSSPQIQEFSKSNETFDVVILEKILYQAYYGLVHKFGSPPVIGILSLGAMPQTLTAYGNPCNPSVCPSVMVFSSDRMTFWERIYNTYVVVRINLFYNNVVYQVQEKILRKYFGTAPPSIYEAEFNDSLILVNNHWSLDYPRPLLPNIVELTGIHIRSELETLPKDVKDFLDGAEHGVIYFSLGANLKGSALPKTFIEHILDAFSSLPQRVLWKWESKEMPGKPSNVMLRKWLPQQEVLAHPNVRVFITQGGLQSIQEATYHAVPMIIIPFWGDQRYNAIKIKKENIGEVLRIKQLGKDTLLDALKKVLNDPSYQENMTKFSAVYRDHVGPSLDRAIWWIEYVIKHNGARHLRPAALDLTWYQYLLLDVIAVFILGCIVFLAVIYVALSKLTSVLKNHLPNIKKKNL